MILAQVLPEAVFGAEVDFGLPISTTYHDLIQFGVPQAAYHTLNNGSEQSHTTYHVHTYMFMVPTLLLLDYSIHEVMNTAGSKVKQTHNHFTAFLR